MALPTKSTKRSAENDNDDGNNQICLDLCDRKKAKTEEVNSTIIATRSKSAAFDLIQNEVQQAVIDAFRKELQLAVAPLLDQLESLKKEMEITIDEAFKSLRNEIRGSIRGLRRDLRDLRAETSNLRNSVDSARHEE